MVGQPAVDIGSSRHFSLVINDTAALIERLATYGVRIAFGPITRFSGIVQTYCYDPDGHLVEFTQLHERQRALGLPESGDVLYGCA